MAKVFTITEGLENLGAIRTGGQGSVYKAKRMGEIVSAVKLLPTPVLSEDASDKHYTDFRNEVEKLRMVNEVANPNVVRILGSGITETGCFPFIEMEFIEGPDLCELMKPPHDGLFTIREAVKVACHLSNALAHCHRLNIRHGDIKSNNVRYNVRTGNYVLLDFGLAVMSDEQRRTSLRHAGAIEFMAPEQNEGRMLFESDVYSFGIVLFELLGGQVPFPLRDGGETSRNHVRLAHMESELPQLQDLRSRNLPSQWTDERRAAEATIPGWLLSIVHKCLEKDPARRYTNGMELHEAITAHSLLEDAAYTAQSVKASATDLLNENESLKQQVRDLQQKLFEMEENAALPYQGGDYRNSGSRGVSRPAFTAVLVLCLLMAGLAGYGLFFNTKGGPELSGSGMAADSSFAFRDSIEKDAPVRNPSAKKGRKPTQSAAKKDSASALLAAEEINDDSTSAPASAPSADSASGEENGGGGEDGTVQYRVRRKTFFHNDPMEGTRRDAYLLHNNDALLRPLEEKNGFVYIIFTNRNGQTSKGWIPRNDLLVVE